MTKSFRVEVVVRVNEEVGYGKLGKKCDKHVGGELFEEHFETTREVTDWLHRQVAKSNCSPRLRVLFNKAAKGVTHYAYCEEYCDALQKKEESKETKKISKQTSASANSK